MGRSYLTAEEVAFLRTLALDLADRAQNHEGSPNPLVFVPARFVTIDLAASITGFTTKAIQAKIGTGVWLEGREYVRRDGRILIDMRGYERWAEFGGNLPRSRKT